MTHRLGGARDVFVGPLIDSTGGLGGDEGAAQRHSWPNSRPTVAISRDDKAGRP